MDSSHLHESASLSILNHPPVRNAGPSLLHHLVHAFSEDGPCAIDYLALDGARTTLSYGQLQASSDALASRISSARRQPGEHFIAPVLIAQSPALYVAMLAVLKAGGAFCPINLDIPAERAKFILDDVSAEIVLTTSDLVSRIPSGGNERTVLVVDTKYDVQQPAGSELRVASPTDLAYVMYTSGSTGTPKGVGISHDAATQSLLGHEKFIPPFSRFLQFAAPTFDVSVFEIFFPLFRGATLVCCDRAAMLNDLPAVINSLDVDACELTPTVAGSLLRTRSHAPGLRLLLTIGEMLTHSVIREFGSSEKQASILWAMYGPTEAAIHCTLQPAVEGNSSNRNIGAPLDSVSAFILATPEGDDDQAAFQLLPRGEVGELAIGGYQLADGYINRAEQTSKAFIDTPYGRLYRTGDKARIGEDGALECLGRIAEGQVKLRGQRIELGEVEQAALRASSCLSAVAAVVNGVLILYCGSDEEPEIAVPRIDESCRQWLPGFMVPGDIVVLRELPRLPSGKADRKRLVAEYLSSRPKTQTVDDIDFKDDIEREICLLAQQTLGGIITPSTVLSSAGMDSISSIGFASKVLESGFNVTAIDIMNSRTLASLCSKVRARSSQDNSSTPGLIKEIQVDVRRISTGNTALVKILDQVESCLPCTPLQTSMLSETASDARAYCNWTELQIPSHYGAESVRSWFTEICLKNKVLRTGFAYHDGTFYQVVSKTLGDDRISSVETPSLDFQMNTEHDFLRPLRIQISASETQRTISVIIQIHHALYDGWSMDMMMADLESLALGHRISARPQFCEVLPYFCSPGFLKDCNEAREFWANSLSRYEPVTLPTISPELQETTAILSNTFALDLDPNYIKTTLGSLECSAQVLFQASLAWIWSRFLGSNDVAVGLVTSGRTLPVAGIDKAIGPFIASRPVRTNISKAATIKDIFRDIQAVNRAVAAHDVLPLAEIKKTAGFRPNQSLYDVLFVYQESPYQENNQRSQIKEVAHQDYLETKLLVEVLPHKSNFACRITYHSANFPESHIKLIFEQFRHVAQYMVANSSLGLETIQSSFPSELLSMFNTNPEPFSGVPDLAGAVESVAAQFPRKGALCFATDIRPHPFGMDEETISFGELNSMANRISRCIQAEGAETDGTIAIVMEKSVLFYASVLAILKAGCAYLPLLPSTPTGRLRAIFEDAKPQLCLCDSQSSIQLQRSGISSCCNLETLDFSDYADTNINRQPDPARVSYVIYTSGSTGIPKGVCVTQLNIMSNLHDLAKIYPIKANSRLLQSCSQAFDVSVFEIFFAWTQGMCLCSAINDVIFADIERSIRAFGITHLSMTPTVASLVDPSKVPNVEFLVTAGEPMTEVVANKWSKQLYQGYGPSETTNICSVKKMGPNQEIRHLGWVLGNTSAFVLSADSLEVTPRGCVGEFCFGGDQVAQGYLNNPGLTSTKFIDHPEFGRIYRSGDIGRMLPDGSLMIVGRIDDQIKIRGQRVELDEITSTIRLSGRAEDGVTLLIRGDGNVPDQLVSFFIPHSSKQTKFQILQITEEIRSTHQALCDEVISKLPSYMIPSSLIPVSMLPTTAAGKLDKWLLVERFRALDADILASIGVSQYEQEEDVEFSGNEARISEILTRIFALPPGKLRRWTPLATIGLDSLSAINVARELQRIFDTKVPVSLVLQNLSVAKISTAISESQQAAAVPSNLPALVSPATVRSIEERFNAMGVEIETVLPCTPLQEAMLASTDHRGAYLNHTLLRLHQDRARVKSAWDAMQLRHSIFRTCFATTEDATLPIVQVILQTACTAWLHYGISDGSLEECIAKHISTVPEALDSTRAPFSVATISGQNATYISFACHHAMYDGVAVEIIFSEVEQLLAGINLSPPPKYELFLQHSFAASALVDEFWVEHLDGYNPRLLPRLKSESVPDASVTITRDIDLPLTTIRDALQESGFSMLSLCQASLASLLSILLKTDDICFGNVMSGRSVTIDGIDKLVAPCFNTIPIRMDLFSTSRNIDLARAFHSINPRMIDYQFTPFRRIQSLVGRKHKDWRLFDTLLILQQPLQPRNGTVWTLERDEGFMDLPLVCEFIPEPGRNRLVVQLHSASHLTEDVLVTIFDILAHVMMLMLDYPASAAPRMDNLPLELQSRLLRIPFESQSPAHDMGPTKLDASEPWTGAELSIRGIFAQLSSVPHDLIHRQTSIYQIGLDSISAVQIASMLRKRGLMVSASDVIEAPSCQSLAQLIMGKPTTNGHSHASYEIESFRTEMAGHFDTFGIAVDDLETTLPCTPLQNALLAQSIISEGRDYLNFLDFHIEGDIQLPKLLEAWQDVWHTHSMLRTGFLPKDTGSSSFAMIQYLPQSRKPTVNFLSFTEESNFNVASWRSEAAKQIYENMHQPPWRIVCMQLQDGISMHLAIHHALYDATSLQMTLHDLDRAIRGETLGSPSSIESCVLDILRQTSSEDAEPEKFWKRQTEKAVANRFPVLTPLRESRREIRTESYKPAWPASSLQVALERHNISLHVLLQAAWVRVLSAYLGEQDVIFGVVLSGRNTESTQNAAFPCINTVPIVANNLPSNKDLLKEISEYNSGIYKHQHTPLQDIQRWSSSPGSRLFDTILVYQKLNIENRDVKWTIVDDQATVDYPISIEVESKDADGLEYRVIFFTDIMPVEQARILLRQFDAAIRDLASSPDTGRENMSPADLDLLSIAPPRTPVLDGPVTLVHQFVEAQAQSCPSKIALEFVEGIQAGKPWSRSWTYKQLDENGNKVASRLIPHTKVGDIVAVHFEKCPEVFFAILGILKAGCGFLALDPKAPPARKEFILKDANASVLLTSKNELFEVDDLEHPHTIYIDEKSLMNERPDPPGPERSPSPSSICYCLYTSGTTGLPKGCEITHENVVQCMYAFQQIFSGHWNEDSRWLQFASLHFDVSVLEQYWSWSVGITLLSAPQDLILEDLAGTIDALQITHIDLTPSLARLLRPDDVPSLCRGVFITGGESLTQDILDSWGPKAVIYNFYGPTEATIGVTVYPRVPQNGRPSNIGQPFLNVGAYVLKPGTEEPVLRGGVGELCVSGKLVGKGYLGREELTAERFPTLEFSGERIYRTGDLVRMLHDDCLDFLGRADDQVKLRGQRLEIGEINHAIRTGIGGAAQVATLVVRNEEQAKSILVSFIASVAQKNGGIALDLLDGPESALLCQKARLACQSKLPAYMVPTYVLHVPFIPLSSNNKAEIKELKQFFNKLSHGQLSSMVSPPGLRSAELGSVGNKIAAAIASMTSVDADSISSSSSIFELGIDSISVLRLSRLLKKEGISTATPSLILKHPMIPDLARAVQIQSGPSNLAEVAAARQLVQAYQHRYRGKVCEQLLLDPQAIQYIVPCSALQQGMISKSATDGAYFNTFRFDLAPGVSTLRLRDAWERLIAEFEIFRTIFLQTSEGHIQVALRTIEMPWYETKLQDESHYAAAAQKLYDAWVAGNSEDIRRPFELHLISQDTQHGTRQTVLLHIFHGLYDANSFEISLGRVMAEYFSADAALEAPKGASFLEAMQHGPLRSFAYCRDFWVDNLSKAALGRVIFPSPAVSSESLTGVREVSFKPLESLLWSCGITHQALVQAAWAVVLGQTYNVDPTIGIIVSGRSVELEGIENTVGPLFNTLPFHAHVSNPRMTWVELLQKCHEFNTTTMQFQHVPLRDIQKWCSKGKPLFDVLFSFRRLTSTPSSVDKLWVEVDTGPKADYPLALEAALTPDNRLKLTIVAQTYVMSASHLSRLLEQLEDALLCMAEGPNSFISKSEQPAAAGSFEDRWREHQTPENDESRKADEPGLIWTEEALVIRNQVAKLAMVQPDELAQTTSLLELGLDSIDAIKLSSALKKMGMKISASEITKGQTIANLISLSQQRKVNGSDDVRSLSQINDISSTLKKYLSGSGYDLSDVEDVLPTTPLQDSMVIEMIQSDFDLYFNHDVLELSETVDLDRLIQAWRNVIDCSPILRTFFLPVTEPTIDLAYCQVVRANAELDIATVELADEQDISAVIEAAKERAQGGAGISGVLQLTIAQVQHRRFLVFSIAHALYDGWSLGMLHRDVQSAYFGRPIAREPYSQFLNKVITSSTPGAERFWSGFLAGASPTVFPASASLGASNGDAINRMERTSVVSLSDIKSFCKQHSLALQVLGQACWSAVLATRTRSLDVTFGVVLLGRETEAEENLMFPTMNTVALRSVLHGSILNWLQYMQNNMFEIAGFAQYPLRKAQKLAKGFSGPLFNTLFMQQTQLIAPDSTEDGTLMKSVSGLAAVEYPICVEMESSGDGLTWRIACDSQYLSVQQTMSLVDELDTVLKHIVFSSSSDVLNYSGGKVTICGMPPFELEVATPAFDDQVDDQLAAESDSIWTAAEEEIRSVLSELSGVAATSIRKQDNIYNLGLDSITALKASSLLRRRGIILTPRVLLHARSITEMGNLASGERETDGFGSQGVHPIADDFRDDVAASILNASQRLREVGLRVEEIFPATPMQVHMLSVWENTGGQVFYPRFKYILGEDFAVEQVSRAWQTLVDALPMLRTVFIETGSRQAPFLQAILPPGQHLQGAAITHTNRIGPLASIEIQHSETGERLLCLHIHHALYDGVSLPTIIRYFSGILTGGVTPDYGVSLRLWKQLSGRPYTKTSWNRKRDFWTSYLDGARSTPMPTVSSQPTSSSRVFSLHKAVVDCVPRLQKRCSAHGISLQALFFAAYAQILASLIADATGQRPTTVVFGVYLANRGSVEDLSQLPYPTLSLVPLKVRAVEHDELFQAAETIQSDLGEISGQEHVGVGLWEIMDWTGVVVDSFVNFLSLPSSGANEEEGGSDGPLKMHLDQGPQSVDVGDAGSVSRRATGNNVVRDAYPDAVDIEVSSSGSEMDIGVFGPSKVLGDKGAEELVFKLANLLRDIN